MIKIEKYANIAPATVNKGAKLFISKKLSKLIIFEKAKAVIFTSLKKTTKKKKILVIKIYILTIKKAHITILAVGILKVFIL